MTVEQEEIITFEKAESNSGNKRDTQNPPQYNPVKYERLANKNFTPLMSKNYDKFKVETRGDIEIKETEEKELTQKQKEKLEKENEKLAQKQAQEEYQQKI